MAAIPTTMRSLVAPTYCKPSEYEVVDVPVPSIRAPNDMLVKIHAAVLLTGDTMLAAVCQGENGKICFLIYFDYMRLPMRLGLVCAGVVVSAGSAVTNFRPGDAVYGMTFGRPMTWTVVPGFYSDLFAVVFTAYQSIERGLELMKGRGQTLEGSNVFVAGSLSATGAAGIQMLKNVYGVRKVVATVSTPKLPLVEKYLPGVVDQVVDYSTKKKLTHIVPPGTIDFAYQTQWSDLPTKPPIMNKEDSVVIFIASLFPSAVPMEPIGPGLPVWIGWIADLMQLYYKCLVWGTNVKFDSVSGNAEVREDVEVTAEIISTGKVQSVIRVVQLEDITDIA
ncbi:hypothetical protein BJ170DRAFT_596231 [Xylariales sp. AK1849]|nr:hypothetical protein BJ170DRAFT_596231 [Xylariales sp. AK1849]